MKPASLLIAATAVVLVLGLTEARSQTTRRYTAAAVNPPAGVTNLFVSGMNESGSLAATGLNSAKSPVALRRVGTAWQTLGPGFTNGINDAGTVVGQNELGQPVFWTGPGAATVIPGLPPGAVPAVINNAGTIIATHGAAAFRVSAASEVTNLGTFGDSISIQVNAINASGAFAGTALSPVGLSRPFRYSDSSFQGLLLSEVAASGAPTEGVANGINDAGQVVGFVQNGKVSSPTFWGIPTSPTTLPGAAGQPGRANDINSNGEIVGESNKAASLWPSSAQSPVLLNSVTTGTVPKFVLSKATTDSGIILLVVVEVDLEKFYVATPVGSPPPPPALPDLVCEVDGFSRSQKGTGRKARQVLSGTYRVSNIGTGTAKASKLAINWLPSGATGIISVKLINVPLLRAGARVVKGFEILSQAGVSVPANSSRVELKADALEKITESSETNNSFSSPVP